MEGGLAPSILLPLHPVRTSAQVLVGQTCRLLKKRPPTFDVPHYISRLWLVGSETSVSGGGGGFLQAPVLVVPGELLSVVVGGGGGGSRGEAGGAGGFNGGKAGDTSSHYTGTLRVPSIVVIYRRMFPLKALARCCCTMC